MDTTNITPQQLLKAGVQFGHETRRWNPKMEKFIFGSKNNIHVIDVLQTIEYLNKASEFLKDAASRGNVLFVGTKKQASNVVRDEAIRAGAYFIDNRWAGGLLTNFKMIKQSLNQLNSLEKMFEEGVQGRTKYEVSRMKKEWQKLSRLYSGIKSLNNKPTAVVVLDVNFEKAAIREARRIGVPTVGIVDTNSDPSSVDYVIPANDDAINSIKFLFRVFGDAVLEGNKGNGIKHELKDYSKVDVKISKGTVAEDDLGAVVTAVEEAEAPSASTETQADDSKKVVRRASKGILERVKEEAKEEKKPAKKASAKPEAKKEAPKKSEKKPAAKKAK
jgi:small subunit ribosomal protein S2